MGIHKETKEQRTAVQNFFSTKTLSISKTNAKTRPTSGIGIIDSTEDEDVVLSRYQNYLPPMNTNSKQTRNNVIAHFMKKQEKKKSWNGSQTVFEYNKLYI